MIKAKRNIIFFLFTVVLAPIIYCSIGAAFFADGFGLIGHGSFSIKDILWMGLGAGFIFFGPYSIAAYYRNVPKIVIDGEKIVFGSKQFALTEILEMKLTGKVPFNYIFIQQAEGATIMFKDGTKRYIRDDWYRNAWELKYFLENVVYGKNDSNERVALTYNEPHSDNYLTFKGNQFTSLRGLIIWSLIIGAIIQIVFGEFKPLLVYIMFIACGIFAFIFLSAVTNYFILSNWEFVVKNHNYFWQRDRYILSEIKEIAYETRDKMPNCLRVVTNKYKTKLYPASTLRDKHWLSMKKALESRGIKVRNECIYEPESKSA